MKYLNHLTEQRVPEAERKADLITRSLNYGANISDQELNASIVTAARRFVDGMGRVRSLSTSATKQAARTVGTLEDGAPNPPARNLRQSRAARNKFF